MTTRGWHFSRFVYCPTEATWQTRRQATTIQVKASDKHPREPPHLQGLMRIYTSCRVHLYRCFSSGWGTELSTHWGDAHTGIAANLLRIYMTRVLNDRNPSLSRKLNAIHMIETQILMSPSSCWGSWGSLPVADTALLPCSSARQGSSWRLKKKKISEIQSVTL